MPLASHFWRQGQHVSCSEIVGPLRENLVNDLLSRLHTLADNHHASNLCQPIATPTKRAAKILARPPFFFVLKADHHKMQRILCCTAFNWFFFFSPKQWLPRRWHDPRGYTNVTINSREAKEILFLLIICQWPSLMYLIKNYHFKKEKVLKKKNTYDNAISGSRHSSSRPARNLPVVGKCRARTGRLADDNVTLPFGSCS